jgi:hypothetical protein
MNVIADTLRQLVRRRLWPVAVLLVGALAAVPLTLAKSPAATPPPAQAAAPAKSADTTASFVTLAQPDTAKRRRVLGRSKDPFEPAPLPKVKKRAKVSHAAAPTPKSTPAAGSGSTGGAAGAPPAASAPPAAAPAPTFTVPKDSLKVRFGAAADNSTAELPSSFLQRLEALQSAQVPVLVFERLTDNGRTAVFSIPGEVSAVGDGRCAPTPDNCETLKLHAGETEFITVKGAGAGGADAQFELDVVKIYAKATKLPKSEQTAASGTAQ